MTFLSRSSGGLQSAGALHGAQAPHEPITAGPFLFSPLFISAFFPSLLLLRFFLFVFPSCFFPHLE